MFFLIVFAFLLFPQLLTANSDITAASYLLVEKDSFQVISGRNYHAPMAPASTTKVMTAIMAIENVADDEAVVPDKNVLNIPASKLSLIPGREYKATDLIKGALIESANDAAYALGTHIGETESGFARMMTQKARDIGALDTQFRNASGLFVQDQRTTCYDLALIFRYALTNDKFREIAATRYFLFTEGSRNIRYKNHNRLLFCFEPTIAGKTGFTRLSRHCYVGAFEKEGKTYILSLLGSNNLWGDAVQILKNVYTKLPSDREIQLAKANSIILTSYREKKEKKPLMMKKKTKKQKKNKVAYRKTR
jgi:serine-type D-Ala-D-Ala carboxypeptidase (penicillin-binding protein 5/6)